MLRKGDRIRFGATWYRVLSVNACRARVLELTKRRATFRNRAGVLRTFRHNPEAIDITPDPCCDEVKRRG